MTPKQRRPAFADRRPQPPFAATTASYLGLTVDELRDEIGSRRSPAEVATARGLPVDGLKAAILIEAGSRIREAAADGTIDPERAGAVIAGLTAHVGEYVERPPPSSAVSTGRWRAAA